MPLAPVERRSVPDDVFDQLVDGIVAGELPAGEALPSERRLSELLGVSRPAVREALQRLSQSRLVDTRHGGGSTVQDYREAAGLDLLPHLLVRGDRLDPAVARSIVEVRSHAGPQLARLCADRADEATRARLLALAGDLDAAEGVTARQDAALAFWDAVVAGADNLAYRLLWNTLRATYRTLRDVLAVVMADEVDDVAGHRAVADAIVAGDPGAAEGAARSVLGRGTRAALAVLDAMSKGDDR
ncbi:MAG: GntR family transcriptional regulator [Actinobacteria bacterium]|nr:GntR family transcriptional regulator [Actinomycetota bacterium]